MTHAWERESVWTSEWEKWIYLRESSSLIHSFARGTVLRSFIRRVRRYPAACERTDTKATQTAPPQAVNNYIKMSGTELAGGKRFKEQRDIWRTLLTFIIALIQLDSHEDVCSENKQINSEHGRLIKTPDRLPKLWPWLKSADFFTLCSIHFSEREKDSNSKWNLALTQLCKPWHFLHAV